MAAQASYSARVFSFQVQLSPGPVGPLLKENPAAITSRCATRYWWASLIHCARRVPGTEPNSGREAFLPCARANATTGSVKLAKLSQAPEWPSQLPQL